MGLGGGGAAGTTASILLLFRMLVSCLDGCQIEGSRCSSSCLAWLHAHGGQPPAGRGRACCFAAGFLIACVCMVGCVEEGTCVSKGFGLIVCACPNEEELLLLLSCVSWWLRVLTMFEIFMSTCV